VVISDCHSSRLGKSRWTRGWRSDACRSPIAGKRSLRLIFVALVALSCLYFRAIADAKPQTIAIAKTSNTDAFQVSCADCPLFVAVPPNSRSARRIKFVAAHELTWKQYLRSYDEKSCELPDPNPTLISVTHEQIKSRLSDLRIEWPITILRPSDVDCYMRWLQTKTKYKVALPSPQEWEWFARAGNAKWRYPWGNDPSGKREALGDGSLTPYFQYPYGADDRRSVINPLLSGMEVGQFKPNPWGIYDLMGNSLEITNTTLSQSAWATRVRIPKLAKHVPALERVLLKGGDHASPDWVRGISQEHFTVIASDRYAARVAVRLMLTE
jgi:formylglycine-generating enzyme required for sulfatase activity